MKMTKLSALHTVAEPDRMPLEIVPPSRVDDSSGGSLTFKAFGSGATSIDTPKRTSEGTILGQPSTNLPDPWLFNSESLIREIDRIRETALQVPCNGDSNATHFGLQQVINTAWTLRENLRFMLGLHRQRQDSFRREESTQHQTIYDLETWVNLARNNLLITLWAGCPVP
jgi:hypothetical protein